VLEFSGNLVSPCGRIAFHAVVGGHRNFPPNFHSVRDFTKGHSLYIARPHDRCIPCGVLSRSSERRYRPQVASGQGNAERVEQPGRRQVFPYLLLLDFRQALLSCGCFVSRLLHWFRGFLYVLTRALHYPLILVLENLLGKYYCMYMTLKMTPAVKRFYRQVASAGGKARAAKYDHEILSEWARKGGRPRKDASKSKSAPKRGKGRRK
jgi:hypothetical protein